MIKDSDIKKLEDITGYHYNNVDRLVRALTHSSARNSVQENYERMEFLGDRVLGLVIAELLCQYYPKASEGDLSVRLNCLVNAEVCAEIAREMQLPKFIKVGQDMKNLEDNRLVSVYADVVESLIASIYLDAQHDGSIGNGLAAARAFILRYWDKRTLEIEKVRRDAKTELQEWAHQQNGAQPVYRLVKRTGPDHEPSFRMEVRVSGFQPSIGEGHTKRYAERVAAKNFLFREGIWQAKT